MTPLRENFRGPGCSILSQCICYYRQYYLLIVGIICGIIWHKIV
jgi:hypothetical protein